MHLVHLGIYKKMLDFYFNTDYKFESFYLGNILKLLNKYACDLSELAKLPVGSGPVDN
jgi:hypothetical protein